MAADQLQQWRMSYIEAELPVGLHQQRELFVLLEAGIVFTAVAWWLDLHLLAFTAQADIMLTLWMCWGNRILEEFTWDKNKRQLLIHCVYPLNTYVQKQWHNQLAWPESFKEVFIHCHAYLETVIINIRISCFDWPTVQNQKIFDLK